MKASPPVIPHDHSHESRDGYLVAIKKSGGIFWNGQHVDPGTLALYLRQYAGRPKEAGRLWLEIEPGAPPRAVEVVRQLILNSDVCAKQGCVEGDWGVERPVVY